MLNTGLPQDPAPPLPRVHPRETGTHVYQTQAGDPAELQAAPPSTTHAPIHQGPVTPRTTTTQLRKGAGHWNQPPCGLILEK